IREFGVGRDDDPLHVGMALARDFHQLKASHPGHKHIRQNEMNQLRLQQIDCFLRAGGQVYSVLGVRFPYRTFDADANNALIVYYKNVHTPSPPRSIGKAAMTVVPLFGLLSMLSPYASPNIKRMRR